MPTEPTEKLHRVETKPDVIPSGRPPGLEPHRRIPGDIEEIRVRGARVHNLKNIDFVIPHNAITVVTRRFRLRQVQPGV